MAETTLLDLLRQRQPLVDTINAPGGGDVDDHPNWNSVNPIDDQIVGMPIANLIEAAAALRAIRAKDLKQEAEDHLLEVLDAFLTATADVYEDIVASARRLAEAAGARP